MYSNNNDPNLEIIENSNIKTCPTPSTKNQNLQFNTVTFGDMHGNTMKLIWVLIKSGVIEMLPQVFNTLWEIYLKSGIHSFSLTSIDIINFTNILANAKFNGKLKIRFLGDMFSDRGFNDYLTLIVLNTLNDKKINYEILISNHDWILLRDYESSPTTWANSFNDEGQNDSKLGLALTINKNIVSHDEIKKMIKAYIIDHTQLLAAATTIDNMIIIFMHAPNGGEIVEKIANTLSLLHLFDDSSAKDLKFSIDNINKEFIKNFDKNFPIVDDSVSKYQEGPFFDLVWNREDLNKYSNYYYLKCVVHGHIGEENDPEKFINLDTDLGKIIKEKNLIVDENNIGLYKSYYSGE